MDNSHVYAYLKNLAWTVMPGREIANDRQARRDYVIAAVQKYPQQHRSFIAGCAWAMLGYGGSI